jgi:microsomal dipeptidase-like Zn-dependent dipeptidase
MWWEWIKRAKDGGLRVMVALAVNSHLLADAAETSGSYDDEQAIEDQIEAIKVLARNHPTDFEIALNPADLRRIVSSGKLAVILGVETDNIGNFYAPANPTPSRVRYNSTPNREEVVAEIDKLWNLGVRYIFPIHLTNNVFGGSAIYESSFNVANKYNTGKLFEIDTVNTTETGIGFKLKSSHETFSNSDNIKNIESGFEYLMAGLYDETSNFLNTFGINANILPNHIMPNVRGNYPKYTDPGENIGHRNKIGLTELGKFSIKYMMQKGMMIDIDHMSEKSADSTLIIASFFGYPVNSGHNGLRGANGTENGRTNQQLATIRNLGGLLGLGHGGEASGFVSNYRKASKIMGYRQICIGTDVNGFYPLPDTSIHTINYDIVRLSKSATGNKVWDYNKDGMAHYGLFPDFIEGVDKAGLTDNELGTFFLSAEYFAQMWEKCERQKTQIR